MPSLLTRRRQRHTQATAAAVAEVVKAAYQAGGRPVDPQAMVTAIAQQVSATAGVEPDEVAAAITAQGLDWSRPFSPGAPVAPYIGYRGEPRGHDYPVGRNTRVTPRQGRVSFDTMRALIDSYDVAQICIRHLTNDVRSLELQVLPADGVTGDVEADIAAAKAFLARPDGRQRWHTWLASYLSDVLRYDAGCLYRRRNLAGDLIGLEVVSGRTILPLTDWYGRAPTGDAPAYLQIIQGAPWLWLYADDLIYEPLNPIPDSVYGTAPIEAVLLTGNTDVRWQWYFLQYFTEGSVPDAFAEAPPDQSLPGQVEEWQAYWDAVMEGDQAQKHRVRWVPSGTKFTPTKSDEFSDLFPLYLMRRCAAAFGVTPNDLGFTEDVNRAVGETQVDVQFRVGTRPILTHVEAILTGELQEQLGLRVKIAFDEGREVEDRLSEAKAHQVYVMIGAESVDEVRRDVLGLPVAADEMTPRFVFSNKDGAIPLSTIHAAAGRVDDLTGAPEPGSVDDAAPGGQVVVAPQGLIAEKAPPVVEKAAGPDGKALHAWRLHARQRVAKGRAPRRFTGTGLGDAAERLLHAGLLAARDRGEVDALFAVAVAKETPAVDRPAVDSVEAHYEPRIAAALKALYPDAAANARAVMAGRVAKDLDTPAVDESTVAAVLAAFRAAMPDADTAELMALLRGLYGDGYIAGAHELPGLALPVSMLPEVNWDDWTPGWAQAADAAGGLNGGPGLTALLAQAEITVRSIAATQLDRMCDTIAAGLANGDAMTTVADALAPIMDDPSRALMVARTETARAAQAATMDAYQANGVTQWTWLVGGDPCPVCDALAAGGPYDVGDGPDLPQHPNCRCAASPAVTTGSDTTSSDDEGGDDGS